MQDTLLRFLVVAFSLLMHLMDEPGVDELDGIVKDSMGKNVEHLQREVKVDSEMSPASEDVTPANIRTEDDVESISKEQNASLLHADPNQPQNSERKPKTAHMASQIHQREAAQTDSEGKEGLNSRDPSPSVAHPLSKTSENTSGAAITDWERDYLWFIWNVFSIISVIKFFGKQLGRNSQTIDAARPTPATCTAGEVPLPDCATLHRFHSKCIQTSSAKTWREDEFLEGLASDLLDAMGAVCDRRGGMVMEDFRMVNAGEIIVPLRPSEPFSFQFLLANIKPSDTQVCGKIKLVENEVQAGCHCGSRNAEDLVCLLHRRLGNFQPEVTDVCDGILCMKNSPFLSKSQVTKWFQSTIKQAWALISHKFDFEMNLRYLEGPGALVVRFRSGKKICFSMNPVVKLNTHSHFFIAPRTLDVDTSWTLSMTDYEDRLLSKRLPENSSQSQALEIALFLHKKQMALTGSCALKDFHFKMALMHLLLAATPAPRKPNSLSRWLWDLLNFMEKSLNKKLLLHPLIGNPLTQQIIDLPAELTQANAVNLFQPLVVHSCMYSDAVIHFQELLRNADMLIHVYLDQ